MDWEEAKDVKIAAKKILAVIDLPYIQLDRVFFYRTEGSKSRAYARTWSFPKIFQRALGVEPAYVVEVLAKYYDKLSDDDKAKVIIHELLHIPRNFSGSLLPHKTRGRHTHTLTKKLYSDYKKANK